MRHVRKYIQYHFAEGKAAAGSLFGDIADDYDGVGVIWFDSRKSMNEALNETSILKRYKARLARVDRSRQLPVLYWRGAAHLFEPADGYVLIFTGSFASHLRGLVGG